MSRPEGAGAAVLALPETGGAIAVSIDGNGRRVACDPYRGTIEAVLECAQNLACVGAEPLGLTNCLNFGNPEKPNVAWQLDRSVQALADVCRELGIPVVGGNVSLYNETDKGPIYPTPVIGLVGELPDPARVPGIGLRPGDAIALVGPFAPALDGSELAKQRGELGPGLPEADVAAHAAALGFVRAAARSGRLTAAHDISDGGLACALAEMALAGGLGATCELEGVPGLAGIDPDVALFGEGPGGYLLAAPRDVLDELARDAASAGVALNVIGTAEADFLRIGFGGIGIDMPLARAKDAWHSLAARMGPAQP